MSGRRKCYGVSVVLSVKWEGWSRAGRQPRLHLRINEGVPGKDQQPVLPALPAASRVGARGWGLGTVSWSCTVAHVLRGAEDHWSRRLSRSFSPLSGSPCLLLTSKGGCGEEPWPRALLAESWRRADRGICHPRPQPGPDAGGWDPQS